VLTSVISAKQSWCDLISAFYLVPSHCFNQQNQRMNVTGRKLFASTFTSAILGLVTSLAATILFLAVSSGFRPDEDAPDNQGPDEILPLILYYLVIWTACFFIVRHNTNSRWYVPFLCNGIGVLYAFQEPGFWTDPGIWIPVCSGWLISISVGLIAAQKVKLTAHSGKS
jgi:hypothetical protein